MKICIKCKIEKELHEFSNNKAKKDGKCVYCRKCYSIVNKEWRQKNPEKDKAIHENWKKNNVNIIRKNSLRSYYRYIEAKKKYAREYKKKNKEKINKTANQYIKNKYANNLNFRITCLLRNRFRKLISGKNKTSSSLSLLGCTIDELKIYLEQQFKPGMTWENHGLKGWHIDHIIPCASFNLTNLEQQKICFHYSNLQPLWASDNIRKRDKII